MTIQKPETFFPELNGEDREHADEWLYDYLRLVIRIHREHLATRNESPLSTAPSLTDSEVLARSVHTLSESPVTQTSP